jgi:hypothetical protein
MNSFTTPWEPPRDPEGQELKKELKKNEPEFELTTQETPGELKCLILLLRDN